jgi:hypothetical protein
MDHCFLLLPNNYQISIRHHPCDLADGPLRSCLRFGEVCLVIEEVGLLGLLVEEDLLLSPARFVEHTVEDVHDYVVVETHLIILGVGDFVVGLHDVRAELYIYGLF